uniref:hypothetical protein n=1 Tax=Pantanalinema rosaneae TaxID=1620701 RepID=UPI003D6FCA5F
MTHTMTAEFGATDRKHDRWSLDRIALIWGRLRHRDTAAYEAWLRERDSTLIIAALLRLQDRQLKRIGMTRATLALDVQMLMLNVEHMQRLGREALELVGGTDLDEVEPVGHEATARNRIAAE